MTTNVVTGNLLNPTAQGLSFGVFPGGAMSQYMDSYSLFANSGMCGFNPMMSMGCGYGMYGVNSDAYYNNMINNSDNMTTLTFVNNGNQHALGSFSEILQKNMPEMSQALKSGDYGTAARIFDEVYDAMSKQYGREITNHQDRLNMDQSIRSSIVRAYQMINGTTIALDASAADEGYFENGFTQIQSFGNHHKCTSEEIEAYITGRKIEGRGGKRFQKAVGKTLGVAAVASEGAVAGAAVGATIGAFGGPIGWGVGAVAGGIIGAVAGLGSWLFGSNDAEQVTEA